MSLFLGIDTSNYTTSAATYNSSNGEYVNSRRILSVNDGFVGLRQSDALFQHTKNLPEIISGVSNKKSLNVAAVGVSNKPRNLSDSYMPVFLAGESFAKSLSNLLCLPCYTFSHQAGHIAAALFSTDNLKLVGSKFIAFHVSGGTTEALLVSYDKDNIFDCQIVANSLDLKFGQAVDRIGKMLGLSFPAGKQLDKLATLGQSPIKPKPVLKGCDCSVSGIENQAQKLIKSGCSKEDVARFCIDYIELTLSEMTKRLIETYGNLPLIFAGGVMSNSIISKNLTEKFNASFAKAELSSDNAVGTAVLAALKHEG